MDRASRTRWVCHGLAALFTASGIALLALTLALAPELAPRHLPFPALPVGAAVSALWLAVGMGSWVAAARLDPSR